MDRNESFDLSCNNNAFIEQMYERYRQDAFSIDSSWRYVFSALEQQDERGEEQPSIKLSQNIGFHLFRLIEAYRSYGHLFADVNPLATHERQLPPQLQLQNFGLNIEDLSITVPTFGFLTQPFVPLNLLIKELQKVYCNKIGYEYKGLSDASMEEWLKNKIERSHLPPLTIEQKQATLHCLNKSELLESFIHTKYVGQKRFSLEGAETLIPMLQVIIDSGHDLNIEHVIIGMAHRGRLNVLSNIFNKSYSDLFSEFEEGYLPNSFEGSGDVKYHKGFTSVRTTADGSEVKITLCPNPSHLEAVNPVVEGLTRALQDIKKNIEEKTSIIPILIHGDAAIAGQGVVYETMQMYALEGYTTLGTLHIIINNQIGFTTLPKDNRSTIYCSDIAKSFQAPVFHVNAEDPESCVMAILLAMQLRQKFNRDVFIDLICYRKYGHNESDEPAYTQPQEYREIRKKKPIREIYRDYLIQQDVVQKHIAENLEREFKEDLQQALEQTKESIKTNEKNLTIERSDTDRSNDNGLCIDKDIDTRVSANILESLAKKMHTFPTNFKLHSKLEKLVSDRLAMFTDSNASIDWGGAEVMAYATLLNEGKNIRLSGQDSRRGTFSHRHAAFMDQEKEDIYIPLQHLSDTQGRFSVYNSPLSEYAVLGFDYGYSLLTCDQLVLWEAQFGDFCNGAQIIIDQFISTGEQKWGQTSGIVLLLPHGYEGQGPEHSSARMERFLTLSGEDNWQLTQPTQPAQLFHLLRRQVVGSICKPLVIFTPKGLLRHSQCISTIKDLTNGCFHEVLDDTKELYNASHVVFCSGRIYFDLAEARDKSGNDADLALIRIEQLYPLNTEELLAILKKYHNVKEFFWAQYEPKNMGAWNYIQPHLLSILSELSKDFKISYCGRAQSASPAAGSHKLHKLELEEILKQLQIL